MQLCVYLPARVAGRGHLAALLLDLQVDLLAEDGDVARSGDTKANLLAHDRKHRHLDVVADHDALVGLACQDQHLWHLPACRGGGLLRLELPTAYTHETSAVKSVRRLGRMIAAGS